MRVVVQRVLNASVEVNKNQVGCIGRGLLIFLGVGHNDSTKDADWLVEKIVNLRIFEDENNKMNKSVLDMAGEILVISQFTLYGDCRKGRRPSFSMAATQEKAKELYEYFIKKISLHGVNIEKGQFQAHMEIKLLNDGPVTMLIESP